MSRSPLAAEAYAEVRAAIIEGRLPSGSTVVEAEVASMLGISRTPVRQALRRLELEGYLERDERGRLFVHGLTRREVADLFTVRSLLEGYSARLAAVRISDEELERLEGRLLDDVEASRSGDPERLALSNEALHDLVLEASRNRTLVDIVRELRGRVYGLSAFAVGTSDHRRRFLREHTLMVRLLREGDAEGAEQLITAHLAAARELVAEGLANGSGVPETAPAEPRAQVGPRRG
jgi:DNA-binding GntR family transcriptional regulator